VGGGKVRVSEEGSFEGERKEVGECGKAEREEKGGRKVERGGRAVREGGGARFYQGRERE